jgi:hypothetical protein
MSWVSVSFMARPFGVVTACAVTAPSPRWPTASGQTASGTVGYLIRTCRCLAYRAGLFETAGLSPSLFKAVMLFPASTTNASRAGEVERNVSNGIALSRRFLCFHDRCKRERIGGVHSRAFRRASLGLLFISASAVRIPVPPPPSHVLPQRACAHDSAGRNSPYIPPLTGCLAKNNRT